MDGGRSVDFAYFDYAKAFDKVSRSLLQTKLRAYGIGGKLLMWLTDRKQRVIVRDAKSPWPEVESGTTQGTVLGFLLFLIFINDLPKECSQDNQSLIMLLADDTKTYQEIETEESAQKENQKG